MPPRYAYWTIIVDDQPTAFRAGALDDIMPTFNRLKEKQPTAKLMWFQSGKLWPSRIDAREAMQVRGERGRYSDPRQDGGDKTPSRERPKWKSKDFSSPRPPNRAPSAAAALGWKSSSPERSTKPEWKPKSSSVGPFDSARQKPGVAQDRPPDNAGRGEGKPRPEWGAKSKTEWKPKSSGERPEWKPRGTSSPPSFAKASEGKQAPRPSSPEDPAKRKWIPKAEYKKLTGTEAKRDDKWRPGGEHKDPRQKYIDAKKAKWGRFKQAIRSRSKGKKP
ncbi:MAG: hypothetical protein Q7R30_05975 [Acidobacteriota bacterium]|nr:hypothetical protein [Acidobacteriota bacterium]